MSSHTTSKIFVIGGTGAQGIPIIRVLVADKKYSVRFLSRDSGSRRARDLLALDNVSILEGSFADHDGVCRAGNYVWRRAGSRHDAWTDEGCLVLAFFLKPNTFFD